MSYVLLLCAFAVARWFITIFFMAKIFIAFFDSAVRERIMAELSKYKIDGFIITAAAQLAARLREKPDILLFTNPPASLLEKLPKFRGFVPAMKVIAVLPSGAEQIAGVDFSLVEPLKIPDLIACLAKIFSDQKKAVAASPEIANPLPTEVAKTESKKIGGVIEVPLILHERILHLQEETRLLGDVAEISNGVVARENARRSAPPSSEWQPLLTEKSIAPFAILPEREYYFFRRDLVNRIPDRSEYEVPEKILVRRVMSPLTVALDTSRLPYNSDLFGIITVTGLDHGYVASVLNSRYGRFFFDRYRSSGAGMRGIYFSKFDLEALPIVIASPKEQAGLARIAHQLSLTPFMTKDERLQLERTKLLTEMNRQVFKIFGFAKEEIKALADLFY